MIKDSESGNDVVESEEMDCPDKLGDIFFNGKISRISVSRLEVNRSTQETRGNTVREICWVPAEEKEEYLPPQRKVPGRA